MRNEIWVIIQENEGKPMDVSYELLTKARYLAEEAAVSGRKPQVCAVAITADFNYQAQLEKYGAEKIYALENKAFADQIEAVYAKQIVKLIAMEDPNIVLYGATVFGRSLAPTVSAQVKTGLTADCTILEMDPENQLLKQTRPAFGGNLMATIICPERRPQMATVRPGIFAKEELASPSKAQIVRLEGEIDADMAAAVTITRRIREREAGSIKDAKLLVVCGKGIGSKANLKQAAKLAEKLGGELGVSRPLVDMGWAEYKHQVGQTGVSVAPDVLIALGVSGAVQHLAGIGGAKTVIAVNTDPDAPIFGAAHYAVVGDCVEVLNNMLAML